MWSTCPGSLMRDRKTPSQPRSRVDGGSMADEEQTRSAHEQQQQHKPLAAEYLREKTHNHWPIVDSFCSLLAVPHPYSFCSLRAVLLLRALWATAGPSSPATAAYPRSPSRPSASWLWLGGWPSSSCLPVAEPLHLRHVLRAGPLAAGRGRQKRKRGLNLVHHRQLRRLKVLLRATARY